MRTENCIIGAKGTYEGSDTYSSKEESWPGTESHGLGAKGRCQLLRPLTFLDRR